jgi:hypothetical protein
MASLRRAPAGDRELFAVATFVLEPSGAPTPGLVGRVKTLSDHALEPLENRDGRDTLRPHGKALQIGPDSEAGQQD